MRARRYRSPNQDKEPAMHQTEVVKGIGGAERKRLEAVVGTFATVRRRGETVDEVAHDARNMMTALGLYCDLLEEPGVLASPFAHYGSELRLVAAASRRLVEKLAQIDSGQELNSSAVDGRCSELTRFEKPTSRGEARPSAPIGSLAVELLANHNLLAALAGSAVTLTVDVDGGARPIWMTSEDLTRVMVNLVKNAADAMPSGGRIQIEVREQCASAGAVDALQLTVEDNGPGIPEQSLEKVFEPGYSTRRKGAAAAGSWAAAHRGLGLAITRSIVEGAGGRILALNRHQGGARFEIQLPVRRANR